MAKELIRLAFKRDGMFETVRAFCDVLNEISHERQDTQQGMLIREMSKQIWSLFFGYLGKIGG